MKEEKPILVYQKNVEKNTNKIRLPKKFTDKFEKEYYVYEYEDKLVLKPIRKKGQ